MFAVSDEGTPIRREGDAATGNLTQLYGGYAEIVLTDKRLLGAVFDAETIFGRLTGDGAAGVLLFALDLDDIGGVMAELGRGLLGGTKEKQIDVTNLLGTSMFMLRVEEFVTGGRMLDKLVDAIARRRHEGPIGRRLETSSPAEAMDREASGQRVTVTFAR